MLLAVAMIGAWAHFLALNAGLTSAQVGQTFYS